ncbi:MAG: 2-oxoacid:acceptor oxidoreductase subunit alpha [Chloroflexi bacterium]|nr:2-oxoacid:acceptor oxidoreductase subunit alpha [Chloroflexota bacterium]|tara:strand:+ start:4616 stop:6397 length:1782 start_codon:yes stop_codon:yes gene_type:complete
MSENNFDFALAIGGEAGQGIATPGDTLVRIMVRRGLHVHTYNAFQSIIRGGHIFLTIRVADKEVHSHGDKLDMLLALNQDTMDRHLRLLGSGAVALYNSDVIAPGEAASGVQLCPIPVNELTGSTRAGLNQNTVALGAMMHLLGLDFSVLETSITQQFARKGEDVVNENIRVALAGFTHAQENFEPFTAPLPEGGEPQAMWSGNDAIAMGGAAAGVKFYAAYPMSPSTGVLHWYAQNARNLGIMVRQVEDEIGVANMVIGAAHTGTRSMCSTSGGGFALMTEAVGAASMMEIPCVYVNVQRAGPSTGVPTKTEQGDLWQALGASQGDFERFIVAPKDALDAFNTIPEVFNLTDKLQCPAIVLSDLLISEGRFSVDPKYINFHPTIDRGELITQSDGEAGPYSRYKDTVTGVSPRAVPGVKGHVHTVATDEHDEDSGLLSDEFTNPLKRRASVEKRARKFANASSLMAPPVIEGNPNAEVTLVGWGSTEGVIKEAIEQLSDKGVIANQLAIKWIVPFHSEEIVNLLANKKFIIIENNYSGQFARYLRSETGLTANGHIRKYDGEPFAPHHISEGITEILNNDSTIFIPDQEVIV